MFRFFRKNREAVKKYLLIFFLSIVSIGMVITLAPIPGGNTERLQSDVLASIYGSNITAQELRQSISAQLRNSPSGDDPQMVARLASFTLDEMVGRRVLLGQARKLGVEVSNQELLQALQSVPYLYSNGAFIGIERYQDLIQQETGMTVSQFEAQLRESLIVEKIRNIVTDGLQTTPAEVHKEFQRHNAKAKIDYVLFDPSQFLKDVPVTPQALQSYFQKDPSRYKIAEQRRVRYVLIEPDRIQAQAKLSDQELKNYYTQSLSEYRVPDRVKVAHILFKTTGKSPADIAKISQTAENVLMQIKSGADFGEMAKKYSEDTTASKGGDLGWIVRGQTVKEFENAAFSMKPGQLSGLIKTTYGIHIIKVFEKQTAHLQAFDEVKDSIRSKLEKQKLAAALQSYMEELERQFKVQPQDFVGVARKAGLEAKETPLFKYNQAVSDLGNSEGFENLAFQLRMGEIGPPISLPKGQAIIQIAEVVPEHLPKLDEVRAQVEEDYRAEQSKVLAARKAREFAARCKSGAFKKLAQEEGYTVKESKDFTQQEQAGDLIPGSALASAFTLAPGQTSDAIAVGSNHVVFQVVSHTPADEATFAQQQDQIREQLLNQKRDLAFEIYRQNLKQQLLRSGELKMNDAGMKQFLGGYQRT